MTNLAGVSRECPRAQRVDIPETHKPEAKAQPPIDSQPIS